MLVEDQSVVLKDEDFQRIAQLAVVDVSQVETATSDATKTTTGKSAQEPKTKVVRKQAHRRRNAIAAASQGSAEPSHKYDIVHEKSQRLKELSNRKKRAATTRLCDYLGMFANFPKPKVRLFVRSRDHALNAHLIEYHCS